MLVVETRLLNRKQQQQQQRQAAGICQKILLTLFARTRTQTYTAHSRVFLQPRSCDIKWRHTGDIRPTSAYISADGS